MKKQKLTRWFNAWTEPPVRPGPYLASEDRDLYRKWDGVFWYFGGYTPDEAMLSKHRMNPTYGPFGWRGLAEKP